MGYANMPTAIGWAYGSFLAGDLYGKMGEKAGLALRYLNEHGGRALAWTGPRRWTCCSRSRSWMPSAATVLLWNTYHPYQLWYPFVGVGIASAVGIYFYGMWAKKYEVVGHLIAGDREMHRARSRSATGPLMRNEACRKTLRLPRGRSSSPARRPRSKRSPTRHRPAS